MRFVIASFMARPDLSRSAILGRGVDYVVGCPGISENLAYANAAPTACGRGWSGASVSTGCNRSQFPTRQYWYGGWSALLRARLPSP